MAFPQDLLEQAQHLAVREPRRPKQASLRRAVSTAYYALFHLLIEDAAKNWKRRNQRAAIARMFDHGPMKSACERTRAACRERLRSGAGLSDLQRQSTRSLALIADTFVASQQDRHAADYDSSVSWTRADALARVKMVDEAFALWGSSRESEEAQEFLVALLKKR